MNTIVEQTETTEISFGDKLRQTREALNLSLEDVAKAISLRPSILAKLEIMICPKKCTFNLFERLRSQLCEIFTYS